MSSVHDAPTSRVGAARTHEASQAGVDDTRSRPIVWWAGLGAFSLAFEIYVMTRWITGPYFRHVPSGPSVPPIWMKVVLIALEVVTPLGAVAMVYVKLVRPWLQERVVATDGLFCIAFVTLVWQNPLSNYFESYLTWNTYLLNMGSWVNGIPGWASYGRPGAMLVDPVLFEIPTFVVTPLLVMIGGCWFMDRLKARWPRLSNTGLVGALFAVMLVAWPLIEGGLYVPLGTFTMAGGGFGLFPDTYHKYPLEQVVCSSAWMAAFAAVRYFRNENGETLVERGSARLRGGLGRKTLVRLLAFVGVANLIFLVTYNVPLALWTKASPGAWPAAIQSRSYFTDYICGEGTHRRCPHPAGAAPHVVPFASPSGGLFDGPGLGNTTR
jgi:hypothetical protein